MNMWGIKAMGVIALGVAGAVIAFTVSAKSKTLINSHNPGQLSDSGMEHRESPATHLSPDIFQKAKAGYQQIVDSRGLRKKILTIVDFSKPSTEKRLFIIDMESDKLLVHTYVAHGRNSGEKWATRFSNEESSYQSSLGFYETSVTYTGSNGYSLRLKGLEPGFNDNAENRAIVMHGAPYVSEEVIRNTGRLGRSWGCPAVSQNEHKEIIDLIKNGSCLFIYAPEANYLADSRFFKPEDSTRLM
jgi:hypothetical protein